MTKPSHCIASIPLFAGLILCLLITPLAAQESDGSTDDRDRNFFGDIAYGAEAFVSDAAYIYSSPARLDRNSALILGGIVVGGGLIFIYDQEIYDLFQRNQDEFPIRPLREVGEYFGPLGDGGEVAKWYVGGLVAGYLSGLEPFRAITFDLFETYYIAGSIKNVLNRTIGRRRPLTHGPRSFKFDDGTSFPSGHSTNIIMSAAVVSEHIDFWPVTVASYTVASGVFVERMTSKGHWPSDVYAGALYGWFVAKGIMNRNQSRRAEWDNAKELSIVPFSDGRTFGMGMRLVW